MSKLPHTCPECRGPAQNNLIHVRCVSFDCPNYEESLAKEFWDKFGSAADELDWGIPWDDEETTLPGIK